MQFYARIRWEQCWIFLQWDNIRDRIKVRRLTGVRCLLLLLHSAHYWIKIFVTNLKSCCPFTIRCTSRQDVRESATWVFLKWIEGNAADLVICVNWWLTGSRSVPNGYLALRSSTKNHLLFDSISHRKDQMVFLRWIMEGNGWDGVLRRKEIWILSGKEKPVIPKTRSLRF